MLAKHSTALPPAAFQTEGKLYLILDFLRGGDLFTRLSKEVGRFLPCGGVLSRETGRESIKGDGRVWIPCVM